MKTALKFFYGVLYNDVEYIYHPKIITDIKPE